MIGIIFVTKVVIGLSYAGEVKPGTQLTNQHGPMYQILSSVCLNPGRGTVQPRENTRVNWEYGDPIDGFEEFHVLDISNEYVIVADRGVVHGNLVKTKDLEVFHGNK